MPATPLASDVLYVSVVAAPSAARVSPMLLRLATGVASGAIGTAAMDASQTTVIPAIGSWVQSLRSGNDEGDETTSSIETTPTLSTTTGSTTTTTESTTTTETTEEEPTVEVPWIRPGR